MSSIRALNKCTSVTQNDKCFNCILSFVSVAPSCIPRRQRQCQATFILNICQFPNQMFCLLRFCTCSILQHFCSQHFIPVLTFWLRMSGKCRRQLHAHIKQYDGLVVATRNFSEMWKISRSKACERANLVVDIYMWPNRKSFRFVFNSVGNCWKNIDKINWMWVFCRWLKKATKRKERKIQHEPKNIEMQKKID